MGLWRWEFGRQGGGYRKLTLFSSKRLRCDAHVLHLPVGSIVAPHTDPVPRGKHFRLNVEFRRAKKGGVFKANRDYFGLFGDRIVLFRPDVTLHSVTRVEQGASYLLSFGWLWGQKAAKAPEPAQRERPPAIKIIAAQNKAIREARRKWQ